MKKTQKGITLIALVITIIVMLILVGVTISMAVNGGLFDYAGKAVGDTKNAINAEQKLSEGAIQVGGEWYDSIEDYLSETPSSGVKIKLGISGTRSETVPVPTGFTYKEGTVDTGYVIQDASGNEFVWVPVNKNQKITLNVESELDIKELKLYDPYGQAKLTVADADIETTYNNTEIPTTVNGMYMAVVTTEDETTKKPVITQKTLIVKSLYAKNIWNDWYCTDEYAQLMGYESFEDWKTNYLKQYGFEEVDEALQAMGQPTIEVALSVMYASDSDFYQDMTNFSTSIEKNGGFYVARYEAGTTKVRTDGSFTATADEIITTNDVPISKEGYPTYNYVMHDQAKGLAESMYSSSEFTSTLLTSSAWFRTLAWIYETKGKTLSQLTEDSESWGNYFGAEFEITKGKYSEDWGRTYAEVSGVYKKKEGTGVLLTTGATTRNSTNNIFDIAGNVGEWLLTEAHMDNGDVQHRSVGGSCQEGDQDRPLNRDYSGSEGYSGDQGFRVALYLN